MFFFWDMFGSWEPIEVAIDFRDFPAKKREDSTTKEWGFRRNYREHDWTV